MKRFCSPLRGLAPHSTLTSAKQLAQLQVEPLEDRNMLSTVLVEASGDVGAENMQVFVNDELMLDVNVEQSVPNFYSIESDSTIELSDLRIEFTNDLYLPEQGIDRNLRVGQILIDGVEQDIDTEATFSTGTWKAEDGVTPGFGRGTVLHANGFLQFGAETSTTVEFLGNTWTADQNFGTNQVGVDEIGGILVLSGEDGPIALSREIEIEPGAEHLFSIDAYRIAIEGSFASDNSPWATAGINFYDATGDLVRQETIEVNSGSRGPSAIQEETVILSDDITSAFMWVWVDGFDEGTNIPLYLNNISFDLVDTSSDTSPPEAFFRMTEVVVPTGEEINFEILFTDDRLLASPGAGAALDAIRVTSSTNSFDGIAIQRAGGSEFSDTRQGIIYGLLKPDGSDWTEADNGVYTLFLQEDSLVDAAGNVAPGQRFFNQLLVDIAPGEANT